MTSVQSYGRCHAEERHQVQYEIFFSSILLTCRPADVFDCLGSARLSCLRFLSHLHSPSDHYDESETLSCAIPLICFVGADVRKSITYFKGKQTKVEAVAEFESKNGPISNYCIRFFTMYETKPVASKAKLKIS